jgi:16S rRNA (cytidine1402-2'-O)-methyltransferase
MPGTLYIVGTPIGNLGDISRRALDTLGSVKAVAAEDTRHIRKLLTHFGLHARLVSFREQNRKSAAEEVLRLLGEGDVALVSDAGMPCISDPGSFLVSAARAAGHRVTVVPGPSASVSAFALSGLQTPGFVFLGFLPRQRRDKMEALGQASRAGLPLVIYEAPGRVRETLETARDALGDVNASLARELTKIHEEYVEGPISMLVESLPEEPLGEFVIVLAPGAGTAQAADPDAIRGEIEKALSLGHGVKDVSRMISVVFGIGGKEAYDLVLNVRKERESG